MPAGSTTERVNLIAEVQDRFKGIWPELRLVHTNKYGDPRNWPQEPDLIRAQGRSVIFYPKARRLEIQDPESEMRVGIIFSNRGDNVSGLVVKQPGREDYIGEGSVRERTFFEGGYPTRIHQWGPTGDLTWAGVYLSEEVGFKYYDKVDWRRVKVSLSPRDEEPVSSSLNDRFPPDLRGQRILDKVEIPWRLDLSLRAEDVIGRSGIRRFRYSFVR